MLNNWISVTRICIRGAELLYPNGINWNTSTGINVVIGGTGLGKTTLIYALQFGIFGKMVAGSTERIEREFFRGRLTKRFGDDLKNAPPVVEVDFSVGSPKFTVIRNLNSGALYEVMRDGQSIRPTHYEKVLSKDAGFHEDFAGLLKLQSHLFFFGEARSLLAWDNQLQHELISLMLSDHESYQRIGGLWKGVESADSSARNLSSQAVRIERDLQEMLKGISQVELLRRRNETAQINGRQSSLERDLVRNRERIAKVEQEERILSQDIARIESLFHQELSKLEAIESDDLDEILLAAALADPTVASVRRALEEFFATPDDRGCPCCGRRGLDAIAKQTAQTATESARRGSCVVCSKNLPKNTKTPGGVARAAKPDEHARTLRASLYKREQLRSELTNLRRDQASDFEALATARATALRIVKESPDSAIETMRATIKLMREKEGAAKKSRDSQLATLRSELSKTNAVFESIQRMIAEAFQKYAALYLDEPCSVRFLPEQELPGRRGPQVKAPHAAFFPVVSGEIRESAQALSDAQRSFIDLAFRMAVIEVWHQSTKQGATLIIETPEGAVDIAYMKRVATMMRTFGEQGHTLIITTNLNNDQFLPEVMAAWENSERRSHILNLLHEGRPRRVQTEHREYFDRILKLVDDHART